MSSYSFSCGLALAIGASPSRASSARIVYRGQFRRFPYAARARLATLGRLRRIALRNGLRRLPEIGYAFPDSGWRLLRPVKPHWIVHQQRLLLGRRGRDLRDHVGEPAVVRRLALHV